MSSESETLSCLQAEWRYVFRAGLEGRAAPTAAGVGAADGALHLRGAGGDAVHRPGGNGDHLRLKVRPCHSRSAALIVRTQLSDQKDQDGSVVDRTWHRSGMNRTDTNRIAVLNAVTPKWVVAMDDTRELYRQALERRALLAELTEREREHVADFMSGSLSREAGRRMMREAARGLRWANKL